MRSILSVQPQVDADITLSLTRPKRKGLSFSNCRSFSSNALIGILIAGCLGLLTGCSTKYVPFTTDMIYQCHLATNDVENLQYYVSKRILLHRDLGSGNASVGRGKLIVENGKSIDKVEVVKYAPGIVTNVDSRVKNDLRGIYMEVSFEKNSPTFEFVAFPDMAGNLGGYHEFTLAHESDGDVTDVLFDNLKYQPVGGDTLDAVLLINKETYDKIRSKRRVFHGELLPTSQ